MRDEFDEAPNVEMAIDETDEDAYEDEIDDLIENDQISAEEAGYMKGNLLK